MRMADRVLNKKDVLLIMKKSINRLILISVCLVFANSAIYFATAYLEMQESNDLAAQVETMFFAATAVIYLPLGVWMLKNKLSSRAPYVIASIISVALIGIYIASRTVNLPVVGLQNDVGFIDILSKILQGAILAISAILLRNWNVNDIKIPS